MLLNDACKQCLDPDCKNRCHDKKHVENKDPEVLL